jgi:hypothetical protein
MKIFRGVISLLLIGAVLSCDAPRLNPLDPNNPDSKLGQINGFVLNTARESIPGVKVIWKNQNILAVTADDGNYKFEDLIMNDGWIYFEKENYYKDSLYLQWNNVKIKNAPEKLLNYIYATLDGFVYDPLPDRQPISGVTVTWKNQNIVTQTDQSGSYKFFDLALNDGWLFFDKDGLFRDSLYVIWNNEKNKRMSDKTLGYKYVKIEGRVKSNVTKKEIAGVKVLWQNQNVIMETNSIGYYSFNNIPQNSGWLIFDKEGYFKDSVYVVLSIQKTKLVDDKFLSTVPKLNNFYLFTSVEFNYPQTQKSKLAFQTEIVDPENFVDTVFVSNSFFKLYKRLLYNPSTRFYEAILNPSDLNMTVFDDAIGKNFDVVVKSRDGKVFNIGSSSIMRIINQEILIKSPLNGETVTSKPRLVWTRFDVGFTFHFLVEIYTTEIPSVLVWSKDFVSRENVDITPDINLAPGNYYWVIWGIDDFQNRSRSKPASFTVQ